MNLLSYSCDYFPWRMRLVKKTTYVVGTLLCVLAIALVVMAVKQFVLVPVSSHGYPYVNKGVFSPEKFNSYIGEPCYAVIEEILLNASDDSILIATEYGKIKLSLDSTAPLATKYPESFESIIEIYFVCCGWDNDLNMPLGYYLGAADSENYTIGLPAYNEAKHYYEELKS